MSPLLRAVLSVLAGAAIAIVVVSLSDVLVGRIYPLPSGTDLRDVESMTAAIAAMPTPPLLILLAGWGIAAGAGAFAAVRLAAGRPMFVGLIVTALFLLATISNLAALPHPAWMWPGALVLIPLVGWLGARAGASRTAVRQAHAPTPDSPRGDRV
jgi:hypothetical protein